MMKTIAIAFLLTVRIGNAFAPSKHFHQTRSRIARMHSSSSCLFASTATDEKTALKSNVDKLKRVLEREYASFFDPMKTEFYSDTVTFDDPMNSLSGVASYQKNVDMLASRTLLGSLLFEDAGIVLHSVKGGEIREDGSLTDITTRWTMRLTAKVLPWKPTARFSGISVYKVQQGGPEGVIIVGQTDYWDSVNLKPDSSGEFQKVETSLAVQDFLGQLKPGGLQAKSAGPELPYQLLSRANGYEVRRYPSYCGVKLPYSRRDEGFGSLGAFTRGMNPLSPAIMDVPNQDETENKYMTWPISYTQPGQDAPVEPKEATEKAGEGQWRTIQVVTSPGSVVAVAGFTDASMGPVVRRADRELREALRRDGLKPKSSTNDYVRFAQYDAIFSMGKRRGEVWIELDDDEGHPW